MRRDLTPGLVIAVCAAIVMFNLVSLGVPSTPREMGYLLGSLAIPVVIAVVVIVWYRRRPQSPR